MKSVTVLLILMALVAGVAVSASRASPAAGQSPVLERCLSTGHRSASYHCQLMTGIMDERPDADNGSLAQAVEAAAIGGADAGDSANDVGDSAGADAIDAGASAIDYYNSNPEKKVAQMLHLVAEILEAAAKALDVITYGPPAGYPNSVAWIDELFDTPAQ